ncbi:MAG TPA: inositol monophosphatase, partial [Gammaproteobacteria bacterium]
MHPLLNIAIRAARAAGSVIVRRLDRIDTLNIVEKGPNDFVSDVDKRAEEII